MERHDGQVPASYDALRALPGVGDYTAAAVASFAYRQRHVVLDTNVRRVLARAVSGVAFPAPAVTRAERDLATGLLPDEPAVAANWAVAVMELGALVCTAATRAATPARSPRAARGWLPAARPRRAGPHGADVRRHRPSVPWAAPGGAPRDRRERRPGRARRRVARGRPARPRPGLPGRRRPRGPWPTARYALPLSRLIHRNPTRHPLKHEGPDPGDPALIRLGATRCPPHGAGRPGPRSRRDRQ